MNQQPFSRNILLIIAGVTQATGLPRRTRKRSQRLPQAPWQRFQPSRCPIYPRHLRQWCPRRRKILPCLPQLQPARSFQPIHPFPYSVLHPHPRRACSQPQLSQRRCAFQRSFRAVPVAQGAPVVQDHPAPVCQRGATGLKWSKISRSRMGR